MTRTIVDGIRASAAARLEAAVARSSPPRKRSCPSGKAWERIASSAHEMIRSGDWSEARCAHHVAAFEECFLVTYGTSAGLTTADRRLARFAAKKVVDAFAGNAAEFAMFARWVWVRECEREEWRRSNGRSGGVLSWRRFFSEQLAAEYRIDRARRGATP